MIPDPPPKTSNVLPYAVPQPRPRSTFLHFLIIIVVTIAAFIALIAGLPMLFMSDESLAVRVSGGLAVAVVFSGVTYLIARSWWQKRRAARRNAPAAPPLTRKQRIRLAIGAIAFWTALLALKLLPHLVQRWK